jgi:D-ribose pyranose/furanose isomerase RbsD
MKRSGILHVELSKLIAELRHGHMIMITDAGFPVPPGPPVIDLALTKNVPTIEFVLGLIDSELITEKVIFAHELKANNPSLHKKVVSIFDDCDIEETSHIDLIQKYASQMKCFIHTGEFSPWGNVILVAGTDPFRWFADETVVVPEFYHKRIKQIRASKKIALFDKSGFTRTDC